MPAQTNVMTFCPAGTRTSIYAGTAFTGALWVSVSGPPQVISFSLYSSSAPFSWNDNQTFGTGFLTFPGAVFITVSALTRTGATLTVTCYLVSIFRPDLGGTQPANPRS